MAIGVAVVVITLIIFSCFLGPGFWCYEWIHRGNYFTILNALGKVLYGSCRLIARKTCCMARGNLLLGYLRTYSSTAEDT